MANCPSGVSLDGQVAAMVGAVLPSIKGMETTIEDPDAHVDEQAVERAIERFRDALHRRSLRMTPVREAIVRAALAYPGHFDVQELTRVLHDKGIHEAALATVYRVMPLLVEAGLVQPALLSSGEGHRFEAMFEREHHDHLLCTRCGKVVEFHFEAFEVLQKDLAVRYDFELTGHVHELLGTCGECRRSGSISRPPRED